jgi:predicted HAD superfamily phosphohydrolase YqeG
MTQAEFNSYQEWRLRLLQTMFDADGNPLSKITKRTLSELLAEDELSVIVGDKVMIEIRAFNYRGILVPVLTTGEVNALHTGGEFDIITEESEKIRAHNSSVKNILRNI